jgi:DNA-3-methyladenine glycosylase
MYWCFNAVTLGENDPSAVLVRAVEPVQGIDLMKARRPKAKRDVDLTNGPGKLCLALAIGREHNRLPLQRPPLIVRAGNEVADADVVVTPRIGITEWAEAPLRYFMRDNPFVSKTPRDFPRTPYTRKGRR